MEEKRLNIKQVQGDRVKMLCKQQGITQQRLAELIHVTPQVVSAIVRGKASLTGYNANEIVKVFPQYHVDWLLGESDIPTDEYAQSREKAMRFRDLLMEEGYNREVVKALVHLIQVEGKYSKADIAIEEPWTFKRMHDDGLISDEEWEGWTHGGKRTEHMTALENEHCDYVLTISGEAIRIPARDFLLLADDAQQYGMFRLKEYVKNKKRRYF